MTEVMEKLRAVVANLSPEDRKTLWEAMEDGYEDEVQDVLASQIEQDDPTFFPELPPGKTPIHGQCQGCGKVRDLGPDGFCEECLIPANSNSH